MAKVKTTSESFVLNDRLPGQERLIAKIAEGFVPLALFYGFEKITTPLIENSHPFAPLNKAGQFEERSPLLCKAPSGTDICPKVSGALSVLRAYGTHKMNDWPHPLKFFFVGEVFFLSNGGRGKLKSLNEFGMVMIGEEGPIAEAEIIQILWKTLEKIGVKEWAEFKINTTGCQDCRASFRSPFVAYFRSRAYRLCKNCKKNLKRYPTRILKCEEENCAALANNAPQVLDYICEECKKHLRGVLEFLDEVKIPYFLDHKLFREGSWFSTLVFEVVYKKEDSGDSRPGGKVLLAEGGRMSRAGELIIGRKLDVAAGSILYEGVEELLRRREEPLPGEKPPHVFLAQLGELAKRKSLNLLESLREGGVRVKESLGRDSMKSQLKVAEKSGAEVALILGQKESIDSTIIVREIQSGIQETVPQEKLIEFLKKKLKK